jgi:hypothetical protein
MKAAVYDQDHTVDTEWQLPLSGVHSIMMEKLAQSSEDGGALHAISFHYIYHHVQSCDVCSSWEGRYTLPVSTLPLYVLRDQENDNEKL